MWGPWWRTVLQVRGSHKGLDGLEEKSERSHQEERGRLRVSIKRLGPKGIVKGYGSLCAQEYLSNTKIPHVFLCAFGFVLVFFSLVYSF